MGSVKKTTRRHVSLRKETRSDNGKPVFILTWTPRPNQRKRLSFSDEELANERADEIEELVSAGHQTLVDVPHSELATAVMLRNESAPGVPLHEIVRFYLDHNNAGVFVAGATVADAGAKFILSRSSADDFAPRHCQTVRQHINRFMAVFGHRMFNTIASDEIKKYLSTIGTAGKTRLQHLITIKSFFRWARDKENILPFGRPTAAEQVTPPKVTRAEHEVYTPEEFVRLLIFTPAVLVPYMVLGQFAGIRSEERLRLLWRHWRADEDNKIVCNQDVTKTSKRRRVDVLPNLAEWLSAFRGAPDDPMVNRHSPYKLTTKIAQNAGVPWKDNALRAGYASYHLEMFDNAALTAKNDGHSVDELETSYKSISGVTKQTAQKMFEITPESVLNFAHEHNLPVPDWVGFC